jgi:hypothetical protein
MSRPSYRRAPLRMRRRYRPCRVTGRQIAAAVASGAVIALAVHHGGAAATAVTRPVYAPAGSNEALANSMAASGYGWTGGEAACLDDLWTEESGFSAYAANPSSDARGIPQNISGWSASYQEGNARQQIAWGLAYVNQRYRSPCAAWTFERSHTPNWY